MDQHPESSSRLRKAPILFTITSLVASPAAAGDVEITALAATDWMYHGTTETGGKGAFGLAADWQISRRLFGGIEAHQAIVSGTPQRQRSIMAYLGAGQAISDNWYLSGTVSHREFPGGQKEWDFTEFSGVVNHRSGWNLKIDYSPDYYEHDTRSIAGELRYDRKLRDRLRVYAEIGAIEFSNSKFVDYRYGQIGMTTTVASAALDVAYRRNSEGSSAEFGLADYSDGQVVFQLSWRIR